jgi:DNA-binding PadR family transcriptional regulator
MAGVVLGPGTLYGALSRLERDGLVEALPAQERRRPYRITGPGREVVREHLERVRKVAQAGLRRLGAAHA